MDIGLFSDSFYPIVDGVGRVVYNYALGLPQKGIRCSVVTPMTDVGYRGGLPYDLIDFISVNLPVEKRYQTGVPVLDRHYEQRIKHANLDLIHAHTPFIAGREALRIAKARNLPLISTFHSKYYDDFYRLTRQEALADIGVKYIVNFYEHCDEVWTVSKNSAETLRDYGYKGEIIIMPNGTPDISPTEDSLRLAREQFQLDDTPLFFYCGQLNRKKNILLSLEAMSLIRRQGCRFRFILAGSGPDEDLIRSKVDELGLSDRVSFVGHLTDDALLYSLYENASLFVFPSLYDTAGMVISEAAAMGTPSLVAEGSAPAERVVDGINGFVAENTAEALAQKLAFTLAHPEKIAELGQEARKTLYLPWNKVMDKAIVRYTTLIERKMAENGPKEQYEQR